MDAAPVARWSRLAAIWSARLFGANAERAHKLAELLASGVSEDNLYRQVISQWARPSDVVPGSAERCGLLWDRSLATAIPDHLERMQLIDALTYLPDDILTKVDRATMAVSLEARVPLLDHRVVEFAFSCRRG